MAFRTLSFFGVDKCSRVGTLDMAGLVSGWVGVLGSGREGGLKPYRGALESSENFC